VSALTELDDRIAETVDVYDELQSVGDWVSGERPSPYLLDSDGNIYWGFANNRQDRRRAEHRYGHKITPIVSLTSEQRRKLASGEARIAGGAGTTYYVDPVNGLDANNGLGPDASAVTNKPWKTIGKALGASGASSGDTVYLSPSGYYREEVTVAATPASTLSVLGDPANAQGFKTSGGTLVTPGPIVWTAYLTNDKTAPTAGSVLTPGGKSNLAFQGIMFVGATATVAIAANSASTNLSFTTCAFSTLGATAGTVNISTTFNVAANYTFDRCLFCPGTGTNTITLGSGTGADYDSKIVFQNCVIPSMGGNFFLTITSAAANANFGGGVIIRNCFVGCPPMTTTAARVSTTIPCKVVNTLVANTSAVTAFVANTSGQITEDYNLIYSATARTNVTAGTHSISDHSYAPMFHFGQERIWGQLQRPYGEPMINSPALGFGNDGSQTSYDGLNRPRPAGGQSASPAAGWLERGNTAAQATTPTPAAGTHVWEGTGPWYQEFLLPVSSGVATTIAVDEQHDGSYTGTKPTLQILSGAQIGVGDQLVTSTGGSGSNNTITSASFTPTGTGWVKVRLISYDTSGVSVVAFSNVVVT
jgi:hypothetical protein